jgi:GntR family transcriptional regulator
LYLRLDHHSGEPIYRQIVEAVKYRVACGELGTGDKLPSIRSLADELQINARTVVKAYDDLAHCGLVVMRQGQGVFIAPQNDGLPRKVRRKALEDLARRLLAEGARMGADRDEILDIIHEISREMSKRS